MEKLLITLSHSDGYTYSSEETKAVIYSSKEEFIIQLEDLTQNYLNAVEEYNKKQETYDKDFDKVRRDYLRIIDREKKSKSSPELTKKVKDMSKKMMEEINRNNNFVAENKPSPEFTLGGQTFEFENFYYHDESRKNFTVNIPHVQTIAEYFKEVELNLSIGKSSKNKP